MTSANYLTFIRIFISPIFLVMYVKGRAMGVPPIILPYVLIALFSISEISDMLDGYLARKLDQVTSLGKILDPMADSIYRISIFLAFTTGVVDLSIMLVFVFIYRDSMISTLRTICALRGIALAARPSGKIKAIIQAVAALVVMVMMIPQSLGYLPKETLQYWAEIVVGVAAIYTLFSAVDYIYANRAHIKQLLTQRG